MLDVRGDFPLLTNHPDLSFLDSGASAQKPQVVIDAMQHLTTTGYANVHRGAYGLSQTSTNAYEAARATVARFVNAPDDSELIFTRGTTTGLNMMAHGLAPLLSSGDEVLITDMEHHANIIPWQRITRAAGAKLQHAPLTSDYLLDMDAFGELVTNRTKIISVTGMSNVLGTIVDLKAVVALAKSVGALVVVDAAQLATHRAIDVQELGIDALAFSAHKLLGPTGIGALWATTELLESMEPFETGGEMITTVTFDSATWAPIPAKFEAGTPPIVESVGFAAAIDYLQGIGMDAIVEHDDTLTQLAWDRLHNEVEGVEIYGPPPGPNRGGVLAFNLGGVHSHDVATILDETKVAVRSGHHCAKPLMSVLSVGSTARASFHVYNRPSDLDPLIAGLNTAKEIFG
jgi:cysteine desulfurase/selenocysteine lyase